MEIRSLEIDFNQNILKINGKEINNEPVIVSLPGPDGWPISKAFNTELVSAGQEEYTKIIVDYVNNKP